MNGPFVVAQAGSNANSGSAPVQIIKLTKPEAGHTEIFHASFNGDGKNRFYRHCQRKNHALPRQQDPVAPRHFRRRFAGHHRAILRLARHHPGNLLLEMGPNVVYGGEQFAQTFTISEDPSVLPAAGPGGVASGADFLDPVVDPFGLTNPLDLLPPEVLPGITFTGTQAPALTEEPLTTRIAGRAPTVFGHVFGVVEEEQLNRAIPHRASP